MIKIESSSNNIYKNTKKLFGKNKPETLRLQEEYDRISADAAKYFRTYHLEIEPKIEKEKERIKKYTEEYNRILEGGPVTHSACFAGLDKPVSAAPSSNGAFVPIPDIEDI